MKSLNEDIEKGQFKNIYLLYGEEDYLKRQYKQKLTKAMLPEEDTVNYAYYEGRGIPVPEIIDLAETMPFFAERRLIVIENSGLFKAAAPELADYIKMMSPAACFLFIEKEVDKRGKLYKAVKEKKGRIVEFGAQKEQAVSPWLLGKIKKEGKKIKQDTFRHILLKAGMDMETLDKEMEKLFCYTIGKDEITMEDVDAVCTMQITNHIFQMVDAAAAQDKKKALDYYYELLALREEPLGILSMLTRQFRLLLNVQELMKLGKGKKEIMADADDKPMHPFVAEKCMRQCRNFRRSELLAILEEGIQIEADIKTGQLNKVMGVELFLVSTAARGGKER